MRLVNTRLTSVCIIVSLIAASFVSILTMNGILNESGVDASKIVVDKNGHGNFTSIQAAINNAKAGDTIYVWAGTYKENLRIDKSITLIGNGTTKSIINGSRNGDTMRITKDWVNITGFTITYSGNRSWLDTDAGIDIYRASNVHIYDVNCSNNYYGIYLNNTDYCLIEDNIVYSNEFGGIFLDYSENNTIRYNSCSKSEYGIAIVRGSNTNEIVQNSCTEHFWDGIAIQGSFCNEILNNTCPNNQVGMELFEAVSNNLDNNNFDGNQFSSLWMYDSHYNIFTNNSMNNNWGDSINIYDSEYNDFFNNNCNSNSGTGIYFIYSRFNNLNNNTFNLNGDNGAYLDEFTNDNEFFNNTFNQNWNKGITISFSQRNSFENNNFSSNSYGINLQDDSTHNTFHENIISSNTVKGILIGSNNDNNKFYHNIILSNSQSATDSGNNLWSQNSEGNYWSDYSGLDNGANDRTAEDGIGDTDIPHPASGMDSYPFLKPYSWYYPGTPQLLDPGDLSYDGNYCIEWSIARKCTSYILEEDTSPTFNSATQLYNGPETNYSIENKEKNTYYYRVKGFNDQFESAWSNTVDIIVDEPPSAPTGLIAKPPTGHEVTLQWTPNTEPDLMGYYILMNNTACGKSGPFHCIHNVPDTTSQYTIKKLVEEALYYFTLVAYDSNLLNSTYSNVVSTKTLDVTSPSTPEGLEAHATSESTIQLNWSLIPNADLAGVIIYINETNNDATGTFTPHETILGNETSFDVTDLVGETTYYFKLRGFDEVPNYSPFSKVVFATTLDQTPPSAPSGLNVYNETATSLTLGWTACPESDVEGYFIFRKSVPSESFVPLNDEPLTSTEYLDTSLEENTEYFYKVHAIDDVGLISKFSDIVSGRTLFKQHKPEINNSISTLNIQEDSINSYINLNWWFKDVNNDPMEFRCVGDEHIMVTIYQSNGTVILQPEHNWNGEENLTFYAKDKDGEILDFVNVIVSAVNDPPGTPKIISFDDNLVLRHGEELDLEGICEDPDLQYGDKLTFLWSSDINGDLGIGEILVGVNLKPGNHIITLEVIDKEGKKSSTSKNVTVQKKGASEDENNTAGIIGSIILIIIVVIIIFFMFLRRRKKAAENEKNEGVEKDSNSQLQSISPPTLRSPETSNQPVIPFATPYPAFGYSQQQMYNMQLLPQFYQPIDPSLLPDYQQPQLEPQYSQEYGETSF